jgi:hypothetical protein
MKEGALLDFYAEIREKTANASTTNETSMDTIFSGILEELSL